MIKRIADEKGLKPFNVKSQSDDVNSPLSERIQPPLEQWLRGFYDAEFVVTDSFHACVFSILFNKPFIVYGNASRGMSRFTSLLDLFGLRNSLMANLSEYKYSANIVWKNINDILYKRQLFACEFITNSFSKK